MEPVDKSKPGRGRPAHKPTAATRDKVEVCVAGGMTQDAIAAVLRISVPTLEKHYAVELQNGAARKRAEWLTALNKAAKKGNASAIRQLLALSGEGLPLPPAPEKPAGDATAAQAPAGGKKEQQQANAEAAVADATNGWGAILKTPSTVQ